MRLHLALTLAALTGLSSAPALADDTVEQSRRSFRAGARALDEGRALDALGLFQEAYRLHPNHATHYNIGLCERALGHPVESAAAFQAFLREGGAAIPPAKAESATALIKEVEAKIAHLDVTVSPEGGALSLDGRAIATRGPLRVNPGEHVIEASAPGRARVRKTITLAPGGAETVRLDLPVIPGRGPRIDAAFWATAGVSAASLVAGAVTGSIALADAKAYADPSTSDADAARHKARGQVLRVVADVSFGVSLAAGVSAALLATLRPAAPVAPVALIRDGGVIVGASISLR